MNWKERFKPPNPAEAGCYFFIFIIVFHALLVLANVGELIIILSVFLFFAYRIIVKQGNETLTAYEATSRAAYSVAALLVLAFVIIWLSMGILAGLSGWVLGHFMADGIAEWLAFLLFVILAYFTYSPMVRFKTTILEEWLGWQRKDVIVNG